MNPLFPLFLGLSLSMDAFAVSVALPFCVPSLSMRQICRVAGAFGFFQALMPLLGWVAASLASKWIAPFDHWIAFALLGFIGGKMMLEGLRPADECDTARIPPRLALADPGCRHEHRCPGRRFQLCSHAIERLEHRRHHRRHHIRTLLGRHGRREADRPFPRQANGSGRRACPGRDRAEDPVRPPFEIIIMILLVNYARVSHNTRAREKKGGR